MSFRWPLDNFTISQGFGGNADYYRQYGQLGHNGIDMAAGYGEPVYAADEGTVQFEGWGKSGAAGYAGWFGDPGGICVLINHVGSYGGYAHLSRTIINAGDRVEKGQLIGYVGATGAATGPHLHFEMLPLSPNFANGYAGRINPMPFIDSGRGATKAQITQAFRDILERDPEPYNITHFSQYDIDTVRSELANSLEKRLLDERKAEIARQAALEAAEAASKALDEARRVSEAKAALEASQRAEQERIEAEAELARIAEEERIAREAAEAKARADQEIAATARKEAIMATTAEQQEKVQALADDVASSEAVQELIGGVSKRTKLIVYFVGDTLIGLGLIIPSVTTALLVDDPLVRATAISTTLAAAGAFILTMFGIYKSGAKK